MTCLALPDIALPTLPSPLTIDPPDLDVSVDLTLCCKVATVSASVTLPFPPVVLNPPVIATINAAIKSINTYKDAIPLKCPRE